MRVFIGLALLVLLCWIALVIPSGISAPTRQPTLPPPMLSAEKLWEIVQDWRTSQNLPRYIQDERLCIIARDRVKDGEDDHAGFLRKVRTGYYAFLPAHSVLQENSVWGPSSEQLALTDWLNSPPHRQTLEAPYKYSCIATDHANAVQIFANF